MQFTTGGRTASFRVPAGTTQAVFNSSTIGVQTGTVAGTITVTTRILAAGVDITSTPAPSRTIRIAKASPVITSATLARTSSGFDLVVIGYSTPREVTSAVVELKACPGRRSRRACSPSRSPECSPPGTRRLPRRPTEASSACGFRSPCKTFPTRLARCPYI